MTESHCYATENVFFPIILAPCTFVIQIQLHNCIKLFLANNSIGEVITAYDIANVVAFLSSPLSKSINGEPIPAGGGQKGFIYY